MNVKILVLIFCAFLAATSSWAVWGDGLSSVGLRTNGITAYLDKANGRVEMIIQHSVDGKTTPLVKIVTPSGQCGMMREQFVAGYLTTNQIAVVLDNDFNLEYRLYELSGAEWTLCRKEEFYGIGLVRRQHLVQIECVLVDTVILTCVGSNELVGIERQPGKERKGDLRQLFVFLADGKVMKNNKVYNYRPDEQHIKEEYWDGRFSNENRDDLKQRLGSRE